MSRQKKEGLAYFPLETNFFSDPGNQIRRLTSRFGADGPAFYIYVLCRVYASGYYIPLTDDFIEDAAMDLKCTVEKIGLMINYLSGKSLLDGTLLETVKVITSHGIQKQYQESCKGRRRDIAVDKRIWLLSDSETEPFVKVRDGENKSGKNEDRSGIYADKSGKKAIKESKGNKRKSKESIDASAEKPENRFQGDLLAAVNEWLRYKTEKRQNYTTTGWNTLLNQIQKNAAQYGDAAMADVIRSSMASNYQGITFDRLKPKNRNSAKPNRVITAAEYDPGKPMTTEELRKAIENI